MLFAAHDTASLSQSVKPCWCLGMMLFKFCLPPLKSCSTAGPLARWPHLPMSSLSAATAALRPVNPSGPSLPDTTEESLSGLVIFDTDPFSDRFTAQAAVRGDGPMPLPGLPPVQYVQAAETRPVRGELTLVYLGAGASVREVLMQLPTFIGLLGAMPSCRPGWTVFS